MSESVSAPRASILVVDDHACNREVLLGILKHAGYRALEAAGGEEALRLAWSEKPDLIISDILMPMMDGYQLVRQLRSDPVTAGTKVIFYTAHYLEPEASALAGACGVTRVLSKPSRAEEILRTVEEALEPGCVPQPSPPESFDREHLRLVTVKLSQKTAELRTVHERLGMIIELGLRLASERDPLVLPESCCRTARDLMGARYAGVGLLETDPDHPGCFIASGMKMEDAARIGSESVRHGIFRTLLASRRPMRLREPDGNLVPGNFPPHHPRVQSFMGVPLVSPARLYGFLYFANKVGGEAFTEDDERLASTVAAQFALAHENALRAARLEREVAERRRAEAALGVHVESLAAANAELKQFAYVASHDLQEPLRMVAGYVRLLARRYRGRLDADADEFIDRAVDGATRMHALINGLLDYSRLETQGTGHERTDTEAVLARALADLQARLAESGAIVTHDPLPEVLADATHLARVFRNLIDNGIKFRGSERPAIHVSAGRQDGSWIFSVRDNGIGIDPKHSERIFRVFQRLHAPGEYPGIGVGLAICKKIVERHGGRIWIESPERKGTTFHFTVPAVGELQVKR